MTEVKDVAASVRQRLLNLAHERGEDFQYVLTHFAIERLIARIVSGGFEDRFILKGAAIFAIWSDEPYRATKDLDLLGTGDATVEAMIETFQAVARADGGADGMEFDAGSVSASEIRGKASYPLVREYRICEAYDGRENLIELIREPLLKRLSSAPGCPS